MIDSLVEKKLSLQAIRVLREASKKYYEDSSKKKPLLEEETSSPLYLQVTLKKIPRHKNIKMIRVNLPHSLVKDTADICLITGDLDKRNRKADVEPDKLHYKELLDKNDISEISEIITLRQLRTEYKPFEAKLKLLGAYDVFLADNIILECLPKVLGTHFFKKRKFPIRINLKSKNLKDEINKALSSKMFYITGRGNSCSTEIAYLDMKKKEIIDNIFSVVETLSKELPGGWDNVLGIYLKTARSKAIPIYLSYDSPNNVKLPVPLEENEFEIDELTTIPNMMVKVYKDGTVETVKNRTKHVSKVIEHEVQENDLESSSQSSDNGERKVKLTKEQLESKQRNSDLLKLLKKKIKAKKDAKKLTDNTSTIGSFNDVKLPVPLEENEFEIDEVTTIPNRMVKMYKDSKVETVKNRTKHVSKVIEHEVQENDLESSSQSSDNGESKVKLTKEQLESKQRNSDLLKLLKKKIKAKKDAKKLTDNTSTIEIDVSDESVVEIQISKKGKRKSLGLQKKPTSEESCTETSIQAKKKMKELEDGSKISKKSKRKRTESESEFPVFGSLEIKPEFIRSQKKIKLDDSEVKNALERKQKLKNKRKQNQRKPFAKK